MKTEIIASGVNKAELAFSYFEELKQLRGVAYVIFLRVGEIAYEIKTKKLYKDLGYDSMKEMLADPEVNAFAEQTVKDYMTMYKKWVLEIGIDRDTLHAIGPHRLKLIAGKVNKETERTEMHQWLDKALELSRSDLITEVKGDGGGGKRPLGVAEDEYTEARSVSNPPLPFTIDEYKDWVREQPCCNCGALPPSSYAHWPVTKQNSDFGIPLCLECHRFQEDNQINFFALYRRNVAKYLEGLFRNE